MTTTGHSTTTAMSATAGPIQTSGAAARPIRRSGLRPATCAPDRVVMLAPLRSAALLCRLLDRAQHGLRVAGHGGADDVLDLGLDVGPRRAVRVLHRLRQGLQERAKIGSEDSRLA